MMIKIIIVHYGNINNTLQLINRLKHYRLLSKIIIVNNSNKGENNKIIKYFPKITVINNNKNSGYGPAINKAILFTFGNKENIKWFLILNNDLDFKKNIISEFVNFAQKNNIDILSPKILDEKGRIWFAGGEIDNNRFTAGHTQGKLDYLSGCCLLIKNEVFKKIGLFDEKYFLYYEDVDFCWRAKKAGFRLGIAEHFTVFHKTKKNQKEKQLMEYFLARNHMLFVKKQAPLPVKIREIIRLPKTIFDHWQKKEFQAIKGIKDAFLNKDCLL